MATAQTHESMFAVRAAVQVAESICTLPAVATQDWCDLAAQSLLHVGHPATAAIMIGQVDPDGGIVRHEATGIAGSSIAQVTTTIGASMSSPAVVPMDSRDPTLARIRASLAQSKMLGWEIGTLGRGMTRVGTPNDLGIAQSWQLGVLGKRWNPTPPGGMLLSAVGLGGGRVLIAEIGLMSERSQAGNEHIQVLKAVLPALARRAIMAIGDDPSEGHNWLTPREQTILKHLLLGKSVRQIADDLGRSPHTVHDHVKSLHRKLGASSRGELVARALGYVDESIERHNGHAPEVTVRATSPAAVRA